MFLDEVEEALLAKKKGPEVGTDVAEELAQMAAEVQKVKAGESHFGQYRFSGGFSRVVDFCRVTGLFVGRLSLWVGQCGRFGQGTGFL